MSKQFTYKKIQEIRELQIEEIKKQIPSITIDVLKLVEMRVQTLISAGLVDTDIKEEVNKPNHEDINS